MKVLKTFAIIMLLMAAIAMMLTACHTTRDNCTGRDRNIGYGAPTKQVLKHYKK